MENYDYLCGTITVDKEIKVIVILHSLFMP